MRNEQNSKIIDYSSALERVGGDASFLKELIDLYIEDFGEKFVQLQKAVEQENLDQVKEIGHSLKGSSGNLSLPSLQEASYQMEMAGKEKNIEKAKKALTLLDKEFRQLNEFLIKNN